MLDVVFNVRLALISLLVPQSFTSTTPAQSGPVTENPFLGRNDSSDLAWQEALRDIAYYLRAHKFTEFDRRYERDPANAPHPYHAFFPKPPLRALHWEVNKFCEVSFITCVEYLQGRIKKTDLRRTDDSAIVMMQQNWTLESNRQQIVAVEEDCKKMRAKGDTFFNPFEGPLERFQWRTTASYYMCWYTMNEVPDLQHLGESCDNYAYCLDVNMQAHNKDIRAMDQIPFGCAMHSFCPDPCCPLQYLGSESQCLDSPENPCLEANPAGQRECVVRRAENRDFRDLVLNRWNVTCRCPGAPGLVWDSRFGLCVDVDECLVGMHECRPAHEACVNLPGTYRCSCRWGHRLEAGKCIASPALAELKLNRRKANETGKEMAESLVKKAFRRVFHKSGAGPTTPILSLLPYLIFMLLP